MKKTAAAILFMICVLFTAATAFAQTKQEDLFYNDTVQSMIIWISYEVDDVTIQFIDPEGNVIDPLDESSGYTVFTGDTSMLVVIPDAMAGQWQLSYDKGSNSYIEVQVGTYEEPIWITEFTLDGVSTDELQVTFQADQADGLTYSYTVYLTTDTSGSAGMELTSGSAVTGEQQQVKIDLTSVNTYDEYYLCLYVYYTKDDLEYFDVAYSESFSFTNPEAIDPIEGLDTEVNETSLTVTYDWSDYISSSVDGAWLIVEADGEELTSQYVARDDATELTISYDEGTASLTAYISVQYSSGRISEEFEKTISIEHGSDDTYLVFPESGSYVNTLSVAYEYFNADDLEASISVNGTEETLTLSDSGQASLALEDGSNAIEYSYYTEADDVTWCGTVYVIVDRVAPTLVLFEDYDGSVTENSSIIILGQTDTTASLTINGEAVELADSGTFEYTYALASGENTIAILASDDAGNVTNHTILVTRVTGSASDGTSDAGGIIDTLLTWLPLMISLLTAIALMVLLFIVLSVKKKKRGFLKSLRLFTIYFTVVSLLGTIGGFAVWIISRSYVLSSEFIEYAYYYAEKAYRFLTIKNISFMVWLICLAVFVVAFLITILTGRLAKKKAEKPDDTETPDD